MLIANNHLILRELAAHVSQVVKSTPLFDPHQTVLLLLYTTSFSILQKNKKKQKIFAALFDFGGFWAAAY